MPKPKIAIYWCASCGGCEEAVVDLAEDILKVVEAVDIVLWPVALDFKRKDVEAMPDKSIAVAFINGAIRTTEQKEMVEMLRRKAGLVVAFGSCAHLGGVPGLANVSNRKGIFERAYFTESTDNPDGVTPQRKTHTNVGELELPGFDDTVKTLAQTIDVDYFLPGCAPPPDLIMNAINAILTGALPPKGAVLAPNQTLCSTCKRRDSKPEKLPIQKIYRVSEITPSKDRCFLEQGLICMGPATRTGCGERCINANMPCRGCFGPTDEVMDQGAKFLSALASCYDTNDPAVAKSISDGIIDTIGAFYMYGMPASLLRRKRIN
jgi:F420-non-reducing hydrogenase small subunit